MGGQEWKLRKWGGGMRMEEKRCRKGGRVGGKCNEVEGK